MRELASASDYRQPNGERRSYLLVDGAQWVPRHFVDFTALGADCLSFSFHKMLAPFGVGVLVANASLLESSLPFLYERVKCSPTGSASIGCPGNTPRARRTSSTPSSRHRACGRP